MHLSLVLLSCLIAVCVAAQSDDGDRDFVVIEEAFDPATFREDLLLVEPQFPPPQVASRLTLEPVDLADTSTFAVHRVQVIALSRAGGAQQVAQDLSRRLNVPVDVVPQGELHAVQAGLFRDAEQAGLLRGRIALLDEEYAGAYVVTDSVAATTADRPGFDILPEPQVEVSTQTPEGIPVELIRTFGWRVLLGQFRSGEEANEFQRSAKRRLRRDDVDVKFQAPWYKVLAGNFRYETDAQRLVERVRVHYRNATKTRGEVYLPKEEINNR